MNSVENLEVEKDVSPIKEDSLKETTFIKSIGTCTPSLWNYTEIYRKRNVEMDITFEEVKDEKESKEDKKGPVKSKKKGTRAFTSISLMMLSTAIATASIIVFGVMIMK